MAKLKIEDIIKSLKDMSLLEINDLVKEIEKEFDIKASAPVAVVAGGGDTSGGEEPSEVTLILKSFGGNKVAVIKIVKEVTGLGLMESKKLVESAPAPIKEKIKPEEANEIGDKLKAAGAEVEIK